MISCLISFPFQPHSSVKWRLAFLASFSMILSVTSAASEKLFANEHLKKALKTESENVHGHPRTSLDGDPKTIDYTLYNYGKSPNRDK